MRKIQILLAIAIILAVAIVFIAPSVDLDPSALRAVRAAALIFFAIFLAGNCLAGHCSTQISEPFLLFNALNGERTFLFDANLVDLYCARLC